MIRTSVVSSNIAELAWANDTAYVHFLSGRWGMYSDVPLETYNDWVNSDSVGRFLHRQIKQNFPYMEIPQERVMATERGEFVGNVTAV